MEGTDAAYCTASGMSAIAATVIQLCSPGDHLIASDTIYGGTFALFKENTRLLYIETVSNPTMKVADVPNLADLAHQKNAKLVVDNTFTPMMVSPACLGADIVVHSLTKFMNMLQNECQFGYLAVSLGYFDTLMSCSASSTASEMSEEDMKIAGISPGLVRISIGYTGTLEQRWDQFCLALRKVGLIG